MPYFLQANLDYVLFLHGVVLLLLITPAWTLSRLDQALRWRWLGAFGLAQAASVWLEMLAHGDQQTVFFPVILVALQIGSFLALAEFARTARPPDQRRIGNWVHLPLLLLAILAVIVSPAADLKRSLQLALGLPSGLWLGLALHTATRQHQAPAVRRRLRLLVLAIGGYIGALLLQTPNRLLFDLPTEVFTAALALLLLALTDWHCTCLQKQKLSTNQIASWQRRHYGWWVAMLLVLLGGGAAAHFVGRQQDASMRQQILTRTQLVAAAIPIELVRQLQWQESDVERPAYQQLKRLMQNLVRANPDLRFVLLAGAHTDRCVFLVDSEAPDSKDYSPPGQSYDEAPEEYRTKMMQHEAFVLGPIQDRWGTWVLASVPLLDLGPGRGRVAAELDIAAPNWHRQVRHARMPVILITLLLTILLVGSLLAQERLRESAAQIALSEQRNSSLVESSPDCVQMFDREGRYLAVNRNGLLALGRTREELLGRPFVDIWPEAARPLVLDAIRRTVAGEPTTFETDYLAPDGRTITWRVATNPVRDHHGNVLSFVGIGVDITRRMQTEQVLRIAKESAEAATQSKSEFLAVMSHEIRTPLGSVIGLLNLLRKEPQDERQRHFTELARDNAEALLHILDEILDTAKIESGRFMLDSAPFRPQREFTRLIEGMQPRAEAKGLGLHLQLSPQLPEVLIGDYTRLRQVLTNLISNAIKFTAHGTVAVAIDAQPDTTTTVMLRLVVSDTGIGIPAAAQARIFEKFEQANTSTTRKFGGTGLGLSIVKNIAQLMGGSVSVQSTEGQGSIFTVTARLVIGKVEDLKSREPSQSAPEQTASVKPRLHLLCAEDNPTNQLILQALVQHQGHTIVFANNGLEAVERLRQERFDAVFMDNRMPIMDGLQATQVIRRADSGVLDPRVPIIALTANASHTNRAECFAIGMDDYLEKPVRELTLQATLDRLIARRAAAPAPSPDAAPPPAPPAAGGLSAEALLAMLDAETAAPAAPTQNVFSAETQRTIVQQYLRDAPQRLQEIQSGLAAQDAPAVALAAHSLKSISRYVDAATLSELGARMEAAADAGQLANLPPLAEAAVQEFAKVRTRLQFTATAQPPGEATHESTGR
ncbi:MAG: response regulator [Opitutae bacterium]|nr:response regulator [Opitutae bacterium]